MEQNIIFSTKDNIIELNGIDAIVQFTRYKSHELSFIDGLVLAEDIITETGITLYTKGTEISPNRVARLIKLKMSNPEMELAFKIKQNAKLIQKFRNEIKKIILVLFNRRLKTKIYRGLFFDLRENIENFIDLILSEDELTMTIQKMRYMYESSKVKRSILFFNHSINMALFSFAIASSQRYENIVGNDEKKLVEICKVGLFHNYGAFTQIDKILDAPVEERFQIYLVANRNGYSLLSKNLLGFEVMDSINLLCEYFMRRKGFIDKDDWTATMTNIALVADTFLQKESGLFSTPQKARYVVDLLNIQMMENNLNKRAVQVFTMALNLQDIFDFYEEMDYLIKECPHDKSGFPYPLEGFKSPTLFICKNNVYDCKHIESSLKAINLVKTLGKLKPGRYHRCWLLTPKLIAFYNDHYKEIKKATADEDKHTKK